MTSEQHTPLTTGNLDARVGRRQALKIGGLTVSLAALVAACGDDRTGDSAPGRVGNAPKVESLPDYAVNDAVLLRTASSLENTAVFVYETAQELGVLDGDMATLVERLIENHMATSTEMGELTEAAGGTAWTSTNPWIMERSIEPMLATILESDDPARDVVNLAITFENMAAATHQTLTSLLSETDQRLAVANASAQEARHSATIVLEAYGTARRFSPALLGEDVVNANGLIARYAIETKFGSVAQQDLNLGAADENGARTAYVVSTPAANSLIYEELTES
jgi:hypothetical protein